MKQRLHTYLMRLVKQIALLCQLLADVPVYLLKRIIADNEPLRPHQDQAVNFWQRAMTFLQAHWVVDQMNRTTVVACMLLLTWLTPGGYAQTLQPTLTTPAQDRLALNAPHQAMATTANPVARKNVGGPGPTNRATKAGAGLPPEVQKLDGKAEAAMRKKAGKSLQKAQSTLRFEQNRGQLANTAVLFTAKDEQATHFFTKSEIRSVITSKKDSAQAGYALQFLDANPEVAVKAADRFDAKSGAINYITAEGSFANVEGFRKIAYNGLWKGVDADFYESEGSMKYDFIVQPHADPAQVRLKLDGATNVKVNVQGELEFTTPFGTLQKGKPYTYQTINGKQVEVAAAYVLKDGEIGFQLGDYDHSLPLIIDPIALKWSTYLMQGTNVVNDIYVHPTTGRIYLVGSTASTTFPNTLGRTFGGATGTDFYLSGDAFVTCMEKDGTTLVWSTYIGGAKADRALAVSVDAAGDVYVGGSTFSSNFPVNGTTAAYDATYNIGSTTMDDIFVLRLNSTGATLKYSTFFGGNSFDSGGSGGLVVTNGIVYYGGASRSLDFPITDGAFQTATSTTPFIDARQVLFGLNTNVGGASGLVFSTFFGAGNQATFTSLIEDKDGNLWFSGMTEYGSDFPLSANAVQKVSSNGDGNPNTFNNFVAKFSKSGQYLYSSYVDPLYGSRLSTGGLNLATDAQGNLYVSGGAFTNFGNPLSNKVTNIANYYDFGLTSTTQYAFVAKIPYDLTPQYNFVSVFPVGFSDVAVDKKGNIHLTGSNPSGIPAPLTAGNLNISGGAYYYVLSPSGGTVLYGTGLSSGYDSGGDNILTVNDKCEAYVATKVLSTGTFPVTPTYRDFETNTQKTVYRASKTEWGLSVFHEPIPNNNTIPNFAAGNNTFCVDGAIWQNPNDGPIIGNTAFYTSGDGSLPTHNIPNTTFGPHPTPASPAVQYQWQKSLDGGTNWINVGNGTYDVYKPAPEPAAGTVQYRRTILGFCSDTLSISNVISATIAGNFTLQIATPAKPVYYCPAVAGTDLGVSVTGASGNISWQWYDGYSPLTGNGIISPSSGTGTQADFTAQVGTLVSSGGFYRLVITDAGGCRKEAFVSISPKTASAGLSPTMPLCPGTVISVKLGPSAINPDFDYLWTGPSGYTSTSPNPTVTAAGTYTLKVKLKTDATFCSPGKTVVVTASTPFASALTNITNKTFCQDDTPVAIGLPGTAPAGYVFQWVPGTNLDNQQAFSPKYDPGNVPGGPPVGITNYTFTALRLSDGCVFERTMTVTNTALAFAFAGSDRIGDGCTTGTRDEVGGVETTGLYFQWTAIKTDFTAGLASLKANAAFGMDAVGQQVGTNKLLNAKFPLCSANGNKGYYIDYQLKASYAPFNNSCFTADTVRVFIPCCGDQPVCPTFSSNLKGTTGVCSGATTQLSINPIQGATYVWTTYSVNGVIQPAGTAPKGLFVNNNGVKGAAITGSGPHPTSVIVDFDNAAWGWSGNNVVVYEVTQTYDLGNGIGNGPLTCIARQQVFSGLNGTPKIGVLDLAICTIPLPGTRVGTAGNAGPYTLTGANYTQAPNSAFNWAWTLANGQAATGITAGGTTPFPTFNPGATTSYQVTAQDPATGCIARDTLVVKVKPVIANAGLNLTDICPGSLVQLGTAAQPDLSYTWTPSAGLNFPIGTPNNTVAQPYLTVPGPAPATLTYTVNVTDAETGCQAMDNMTIGVTSTPPPAIAAATYVGCANGTFAVGPAGSLTGATYAWTVQSGSADLAWLSSTSVRNPTITLPADFNGPAVFRLTLTKGICGSVFADYTINNDPPMNLGGPYTFACGSTNNLIGETYLPGYTYSWSPYSGLTTNGTTAYAGENLSQVRVKSPNVITTYTVTRKNDLTGCVQTATVVVNPPAGVAVDAGADKAWCPGSLPIPIGASGSGTLTWTARGYTANLSAATPTAIGAGMTSGQMLGYLSGTSGAVVNFVQSTPVSGQYVYRLTSTANGCSIFDDVIVRVSPVVTGIAGLGQNVCLGGSVQLGATTNPTSLNYLWTALNPSNAGNTISDATAARPFVAPTVNTTYQVTYTDPITGCSADEQVTVVVNPLPAITISTSVACASTGAQDLTSFVTNYATLTNPVWYKDVYPGGVVVTTPTAVTVNQTTTYFVVTQNSLGCRATAQLTLTKPVTPNITANGQVDCTTRTFNLATIQGTPSVPGNTLEWHSANNTDAATLITNLSVGVGTYYLFEKTAAPANCYSASDVIVIASTCPAIASLGDYVFEDVNANGIQESTDKPIPGVTVSLLSSGTLVATTTTNASGLYSFTGLTPGVPYSVSFTAPAGFTATVQNNGDDALDSDGNPATGLTGVYTLTANENNPTVDMGYYRPASLGDYVWVDVDKDGQQDAGESPIPGVIVTLVSNGTVVATTTTDGSGLYSFTGLTPGKPYSVSFTTPAGYTATTPNSGNDATDSDPVGGITAPVTLTSGENNTTLDAGFYLITPGLTVTVSSAPVCNSLTNNYTATASVSLTNVQAGTTLTLTDNGITIGTVSLTAGQTTASFATSGSSNASSHTLVATLTGGTSASVTYTAPAPCTVCSLSLVTNTLPKAQVTVAYSQTILVTGGTLPYSFSVGAGTLPAGLSLNPTTGIVSGIPAISGAFPTTLVVTDARGCAVLLLLSTFQVDMAPDLAIAVVVNSPVCNSATNTYVATGTVSLTNSPAGSLTITDNGSTVAIINVTAGQTSANFSLTGISNGPTVQLVSALLGTTSAGTTYTTPASCTAGAPAYAIAKTVNLNRVEKGGIVTYTISLTNIGNATGTNLVVGDQLSTAAVTFVGSPTASVGTFSPAGNSGNWSIASLAAGQVATLSFQVQINEEGLTYNTATAPDGKTVTACLTVPYHVCANVEFEFQLTAPASYSTYQWSRNGVLIPGATSGVYNVTAIGEYTVSTTNAAACPSGTCCPFVVVADAAPSLTAVGVAATCTGATPLNNASISLVGSSTNAVSYNISAGTSFTDSAPLFASNQPLLAVVGGVLLVNQPNPAQAPGSSYTIRVYAANGCYSDVVVVIPPAQCACPPVKCVPVTVKKVVRR
ncbi:SdrD B-like domain-containing protein [Fibrella aquatica]|uniref:SdrD B-like domain-containing protein n=1 Tax=Fibrella aquatica TaxID=3242487 RepID=UPI0035218330